MIRLSFIGCGAFARRYHLPVLYRSRDVSVGVICDPSSAPELAAAAEALGARITDRIEEVWDPAAGDAVIISTPHTLHAEQSRRALNEGKHILVDKPFVMKDEDARELSQLATSLGRVNGVAFNRRFDAAFLRARQIIGEGGIGPVRHVETVQLGYERAGWFLVPELGGGGPFTGRASHMADIVPWLLDSPPLEVRGRLREGPPGRSDHGGFIDLRFADVDCRMTCIEAGFHMWDEVRIYGENGLIELRRPLDLPIGWSLSWVKDREGKAETMSADATPGAATLDFLSAVRAATKPACSFADARTSVRVVEAAFRSARQGERWLNL